MYHLKNAFLTCVDGTGALGWPDKGPDGKRNASGIGVVGGNA